MKKVFLSSLVLLFFSVTMIIFQVSCSKNANANNNNTTQLGKILYTKGVNNVPQLWTANLDGTNQQQVSITLPANIEFGDYLEATITPNGDKIVFQAKVIGSTNTMNIYTCNIDGSNVTQIVGNSTNGTIYYNLRAY